METREKMSVQTGVFGFVLSRLYAYFRLSKPRLTSLVLVSSVFGLLIGSSVVFWDWISCVHVFTAGFLITASANTLNQVIETHTDALMKRTARRPLPMKEVGENEAIFLAIIEGILGVYLLGYWFNVVTALLGLVALLSYAFVYTPLKRVSPVAVLVGAIPGALPTLIGYTAATGSIGMAGWAVFAIQFIWQFPHFWAIAWLLDQDYRNAGFNLLPTRRGSDVLNARIIMFYTLMLIPGSFVCMAIPGLGFMSVFVCLAGSLLMIIPAYSLLRRLDFGSARKLMFASFLYLPFVQIFLILDKWGF